MRNLTDSNNYCNVSNVNKRHLKLSVVTSNQELQTVHQYSNLLKKYALQQMVLTMTEFVYEILALRSSQP